MLDFIISIQQDIMLALGSICLIIVFFIVMTGVNTKKKRALLILEIGAAVLLLSARFTLIYNGLTDSFSVWMNRISNFFDFFAIVIVLYGCNYYLKEMFKEAESIKKNLFRFTLNDLLLLFHGICICLSPINGMYYSLDENNVYSRGPAIWICFSLPLIILLIELSLILQYYKHLSKNMRLSVLLFVIMPFPAAVLQFLYYGLESINITVVAMAVLLYFFDLADINKTADMSLRAIAANEAKSAFLSNMSHEIRTPINAVLGMNEMILRESEDPAIINYAENIRSAGSTLLGLVNDILDFSKIEAGKIEIIPVDYDLSELIEDLVHMIYARTDEKGLELRLDIDRTIPKLLNGDEIRIKQVITNILTNAVKYTDKGSITFRIQCERKQKDPDLVEIRVTVTDTGIGIKKEDMQRLFSKFERIEEKRNRSIEGTGLGMNITQNLLKMMGSELQVESEYGHGSSFSFLLEQKVLSWDELGDYEKTRQEHLKRRRHYKERLKAPDAKVLVVDDNAMNLAVFTSLVKQTLLQVDTAESGDECLALTQKTKYDAIFLDHMMPEKDGIETLKELKAQTWNPNAEVPIISLTANAISGAREQYISAGFVDYLTKPIDAEKLEAMLIRYLPGDKVKLNEAGDEDVTEDEEKAVEMPDWLSALKDQSLIDVSSGIQNNGSPEAYLSLLKMFYQALDEKTAELQKLYVDGDFRNYTVKVHALKSSLRIIGAEAAGETAQRLEDAGKANDTSYISEYHPKFMEEVLKIKELLQGVVPEEQPKALPAAAEKPLADEELIAMALDEIKTAAEEKDMERLDAVFSELEDFSIPEDKADLFSKIKTAASVGDYSRIIDHF